MADVRRNPQTGQVFFWEDGMSEYEPVDARRNPDTNEVFVLRPGASEWQSVGVRAPRDYGGAVLPTPVNPAPSRSSRPPALAAPSMPDAPSVTDPRANRPTPRPVPPQVRAAQDLAATLAQTIGPQPGPADRPLINVPDAARVQMDELSAQIAQQEAIQRGAPQGSPASAISARRLEQLRPEIRQIAELAARTSADLQDLRQSQPASDMFRRAAGGVANVAAGTFAAGASREGNPTPSFSMEAQWAQERVGALEAQLEVARGYLERGISQSGGPLTEQERAAGRDDVHRIARDLRQAYTRLNALTPTPPARLEDSQSFQAADATRDWMRGLVGETNPEFDDRFVSQLSEGVGNLAGFITIGLFTGGLGTAYAGAGLNAEGLYRDALANGAPEADARDAFRAGSILGATEAIPISRALNALPASMRPEVTSRIGRHLADIAQSSGEEAAQEAFVQIGNNIIASELYDPDRGWSEGVVESAAVGAILGAGTGTIGTTLRRGPQQQGQAPDAATETPALPPPPVITPPPAAPSSAQTPPQAPQAPPAAPQQPEAAPVDVPSPDPRPAVQNPPEAPDVRADGPSAGGATNEGAWNQISGIDAEGNPTGNVFWENATTGQVLSDAAYQRQIGAAGASRETPPPENVQNVQSQQPQAEPQSQLETQAQPGRIEVPDGFRIMQSRETTTEERGQGAALWRAEVRDSDSGRLNIAVGFGETAQDASDNAVQQLRDRNAIPASGEQTPPQLAGTGVGDQAEGTAAPSPVADQTAQTPPIERVEAMRENWNAMTNRQRRKLLHPRKARERTGIGRGFSQIISPRDVQSAERSWDELSPIEQDSVMSRSTDFNARQTPSEVTQTDLSQEETAPTGAAADPAFQAAQDTGRLEVVDGSAADRASVEQAAAQADPNPSDAQKQAENYRKGHIKWNGLDISIENAKGSTRSGTDGDGNTWSVKMPAHYGYVRRTEGADGDHVDVYIGDQPDAKEVFVIDQVNAGDRSFDEHKAMIGFPDAISASDAHENAFSDGRGKDRLGGLTAMNVSDFKDWLQNGDTTQPISSIIRRPKPDQDPEPASDAANTDPEPGSEGATPRVRLGRRIARMIANDTLPKNNAGLMSVAAREFGGTIAQGAFTPKDAYEALELGVNLFIQDRAEAYDPTAGGGPAARAHVDGLQEITDSLPTQTRRDADTDAFQQFSTPPAYAYAINWLANLPDGARVLEPSAGNGGIAVFAQNAGAVVDVNEIADRRMASLKELDFNQISQEDGEQLANIWASDGTRSYDVVVMNPPFSAAGSRGTKNTSATGAKHIEQAFSLLKPGGRLVAIMGHTFRPSNSRVAPFFDRIARTGTVRANVEINGDAVYKKFGTSYDSRVLIIDKVPGLDVKEITGRAESIDDLIGMLEEVRNGTHFGRRSDETVRQDRGQPNRENSDQAAELDPVKRAAEPERSSEPDDLASGSDRAGRDSQPDPAPRSRARPARDSETSDQANAGTSRDGAGGSGGRPASGGRPSLRVRAADDTAVETTSGGFAKYRPTGVRIEGAADHPMLLVESSAMASVKPPAPAYDMALPSKMVEDGLISEAQLEQVLYAGAAHDQMLPTQGDQISKRRGYMIGDGTGVGKTAEIGGIIADNWSKGRKRHVLISKDKKLFSSARREFDRLGMNDVPIADLGKVKADGKIDRKSEGVMFATYSTLARKPRVEQKSRIEQLVDWVGPGFEGTIIFDEAHLAGNALSIKGKRGRTDPSSTALAVIDLQNALPNARVVYASATAATEVQNLAYADRLGLWGAGTPFAGIEDFVNQVKAGGIAAMEVVARDMKQMGSYMARTLSFEGVEYAKVEHKLTQPQRQMYDAAARSWQKILSNIEQVIADHTDGGGRQRGAATAQFWSAHQRFFQQVLTSMQMPAVIKSIRADLDAGMAPVIQIVNTNEAATNRAISRLEDGDTLDDIDITPRDDIIQYLENSFPVHQFEEYVDDDGRVRSRPVTDSKGNPVKNAEAMRIRDELVEEMAAMTLPGNPLDLLIETFGADNVAEVTGRTNRIVMKDGKSVTERRSQNKTLAEAAQFQNGKRDVLIFSDAGGTGMDFHADLSAKNQKRRSHYVLQAGWRADRAIQGFGRTHRTNQAQPPIYKLAGTDLSGHKRFTSSIARRLDQLGALTKGQSDTGGGGMFDATDNLENIYADAAVLALMREIYAGKLEGWDAKTLVEELGLRLETAEGGFSISKVPSVPQFLNRLLNTTIDRQNALFERFIEHMQVAVQTAIEQGTFTAGVEEVKHNGATLQDSKEAWRSATNGGHSEYQMIAVRNRTEITPFADIDAYENTRWKKNTETGAVYGFRPASNRTAEDGQVIPTYYRYSPIGRDIIDSTDYRMKYEMVEADEAKASWNEQIDDAPEFQERTLHLVTGTLLPIWDRLPRSSPKIVRISLDDGRTLLGREIPDIELTTTLERLGVGAPEIDMNAAQVFDQAMQGRTVVFSSGHKVMRRRVGGEQRVEVISPPNRQYEDVRSSGNFSRLGMQIERIQFKSRAFVPDSDDGRRSLEQFMTGKSIVNVVTAREQAPVDGKMADGGPALQSLRQELNRLGLNNVDLRYDPTIAAQGIAQTDYWGRMSMTLGQSTNPQWTVGHEAIHFYRHLGLFTAKEWSTLSRAAEKHWLADFDIATRYPHLTDAERIEEAVAEAFGRISARRGKRYGFHTDSAIMAALKKIANLIKAVRNWARGNGLQTPADIFHAMARGEIATRKRRSPGWESQATRLMAEQRKPADKGPNGSMHLPDRRIWDALSEGNVTMFQRWRNVRGAAGDFTDLVRTRIQDRFLPILRAQQLLERQLGGKVDEDMDVYLAEEMYSGRTGYKLDKIDQDYTAPIIEIIGKTEGMTPETVGRYLYARHAQERNAHIGEINPELADGGSGMSNAEAIAILDEVKRSDSAKAYAEIGKLIDDLREWGVNERVEMGLLTQTEASAWRNSYQHYVPLKGWAETENADAQLDVSGVGSGYNVRGMETRRALGRQTEAFNPLIAALTQAQEVAVRSEKNRVGQHLFRLASEVPAKGLWTVKRTETKRVFNETTGLVEERSMAPITLIQAANEFAVKVDGVEHRVILNDLRLARAMTRVGVESLGPITRLLMPISRYISAVNTMLDPEFIVRNFVRDNVTANIVLRSKDPRARKAQAAILRDTPKALIGAYRGLGGKADTEWSRYFQEFSESGGKVSFWILENPEASAKNLKKRLKATTGLGYALSFGTLSISRNPILNYIERINLAVDNAIRLSAFVNARRQGMTSQEAASVSKNLTVNFNRRGEYGTAINSAYVFGNAAMQGTHVLLKSLKSRQVKSIAVGMIVLGYVLDQANAYLSEEDEDGQLAYDKIPDWQHEMNLMIMRGSGADSADDAIRIWLPYGFNIFPYIGNRISQVQRGRIGVGDAISGVARTTFSAFSPINGKDFVSTVTPTILDPVIEVATNEDWLGRPIYPDYPNMTEPDSQRYNDSVTDRSRVIAETVNRWTGGSYAESGWVDVSPETIDHWTAFLTGGIGRTSSRFADTMTAFLGGDASELQSNQIPFVRSLYTDTGEWMDRSVYFDRNREIEAAYGAARTYQERGDEVPPHVQWLADLRPLLLDTERQRKGQGDYETEDPSAAFIRLNTAYVRAWQANTPYSSESIFD